MFKSALPHLQMFIFTFVIAMTFPIGKQLMLEVPPMIATWLRYIIAATLFTLLLTATRRLTLPTRSDLLRYTLVCLPSLLYFTAMFSALTQTTAFATSALYTSVPLITGLLVVLTNRHLGKLSTWAALGLGFIGALTLVVQQASESSADITWNSGYSLFMLGCVAMAANPLVIKACYRQEDFMVFTGWSLIAASLILSVSLIPDIAAYNWKNVSTNAWLATLYLAIFATAISFFLFQKASVRLAPEQVSAYIFLIPVFVLLTGESITINWAYAIPALFAVSLAMLLLMRKK
ncbi:DMT family transporter [Shewanella schlegeliana]|uniref:DMT family transporter n=1 Tax=Shewanella schlegeliana TaxID=190308 RepID=A0ABS1T4X7_9GAMM|nr:DMT family transporter [Shewanella schlegeliana]MBL4915199.1 DMT family transporter [Shewanella schlegeliana]MCL1110933.1 DMT family transporter [Shewanella schlegeliana]GIU29551.1 multidrug DMT transporter [Shewanella schlegeliana]